MDHQSREEIEQRQASAKRNVATHGGRHEKEKKTRIAPKDEKVRKKNVRILCERAARGGRGRASKSLERNNTETAMVRVSWSFSSPSFAVLSDAVLGALDLAYS